MSEKQNRDVERVYSTSEFVSKLRRLANALEATCPPEAYSVVGG